MVDKMAPQFLEVPGRAAEQGVDAIPDFSEQIVTIHAVVVLRVSNHRLNRRAPFEQFAQLRGKIPPSGDVNRDRLRMIAWGLVNLFSLTRSRAKERHSHLCTLLCGQG